MKGKRSNISKVQAAWASGRFGWRGIRNFWKGERQAQKQALPNRLADDWSKKEHEAEWCHPGSICDICKKRGAK